jgi:hypothetical protein
VTTRAILPLNAEAAKAADQTLVLRQKSVNSGPPRTSVQREQWLEAYAEAGGKVEKVQPSGRPVRSAVAPCPLKRIDLKYLQADGTPVAGAQYVIESHEGKTLYQGTLDRNGQATIMGVPADLSSFRYYFKQDPAPYTPVRKPQQKPHREQTHSALQSVGQWIWGTLQGDFNKDPSMSQIAVNAVLGLIPLVDQALDVRDLIAGLKDLIEYYTEDEQQQRAHDEVLGLSYETYLWLNIFIIALGCIPEIGSALKGVLKALLKSMGEVTGALTPKVLQQIWEYLVKVLNKFGKGNAHEWLKQIPGKLDGWMSQAATKIRGALGVLEEFLRKLEARASSLLSNPFTRGLSERLHTDQHIRQCIAWARQVREALQKTYARLEQMKAQVNQWIREQLTQVIEGKHHFPKEGTPGTPAHPNVNLRKQEATPPPQLPQKPGLLGKDGKFKDPELEARYQKYKQGKEKLGKAPRDREDWKKQSDYFHSDSQVARGNAFDNKAGENYKYNQVHLENGKRLDSYVPPSNGKPGEIISRKATDFDEVSDKTFKGYLNEMDSKYAKDTVIRSNKYPDLDGKPLSGEKILEVPSSNLGSANRQRFEDLAKEHNVKIRYTPE